MDAAAENRSSPAADDVSPSKGTSDVPETLTLTSADESKGNDGSDAAPPQSQEEHAPSSTPAKKNTVAEIPKFRFVSIAKKSEGYSSSAAGVYIEGKSAEELVSPHKLPVASDVASDVPTKTVPVLVEKLNIVARESEMEFNFESEMEFEFGKKVDVVEKEEAEGQEKEEEEEEEEELATKDVEEPVEPEIGTQSSDDVADSEDVDEEAGITNEAENIGVVKDQTDDKEANPKIQNKNRRCYIIFGVLSCLVIAAVAIAVPIVVGNKGSETNTCIAQSKSICGRSIPIDLTNTSTWPTPSTPTLFQANYDMNEITLVKSDAPDSWGDGDKGFFIYNIGMQLNSFFRAFDYSHDTRLPLYITQDNYFFRTVFFQLFMGGCKKDVTFWEMLGGILGAKIAENEATLARQGKVATYYKSPEELNSYVGDELDTYQIRNHRDTLLRKLFQYPTLTGGDDDVCSLIQSEGPSKKYTVVHLSDEKTNSFLSELNRLTGLDHSAAVEMSPEYVKAFLTPLEMLNSDIYPIATGEYEALDTSVADRVLALVEDDVLGSLIRLPKEGRHMASVLYFAVLADVYIGNPVDHNSMWIARMRCALGLCSNTFILTKRSLFDWKVEWVSYVNETNYLELYDREKLGLWSG